MYAIVDIETTGGYAENHRITEVAIYHHDGMQITDTFHTLNQSWKKYSLLHYWSYRYHYGNGFGCAIIQRSC